MTNHGRSFFMPQGYALYHETGLDTALPGLCRSHSGTHGGARLCTKSGNLICFLCGLCVSLRLSALKGPLTQRTQRYAEGRRGKTSISTRLFVQSRTTSLCLKSPASAFETSKLRQKI